MPGDPRTLDEMRTEVYARLAETSGFFTDAQITQWLNDGVEDICLDIEPLARNATVDVTADTGEYALPCDTINVRWSLYYDTANTNWMRLTETKYDDLFDIDPNWEEDRSTFPTHFYWRVNIIGLFPIPDTSATAGLRIYYTHLPESMSADADVTGLDAWLDKAVVLYALWRCKLKDRDEQRAREVLAEYKAIVNQAGKKLNKHRKQHAPRLVVDQSPYRIYYQNMNRRIRATSE